MKIGPYNPYAIETGRLALDGGAMFGSVPKPLWEKTNPADGRNRITLASRSLLIVGNGRKILVDTGCGTKLGEKLRDIYRVEKANALGRSLEMLGVAFADITDVILTHLHWDHAGGSTFIEDGEYVNPTFPNARFYVQKAHWDWAQNPTEKDRASFMPDDFMPLKGLDVLEFVDGERELFPGISVLVMNGHTMAQQLPMITDGKTTLLFCCDLIPTSTHIALPYIMGYDLRPLTTLEDKKRILARACDEGWILFFQHDPKIEAGTVKRTEKGYHLDREMRIAEAGADP